MANRDDVFWAVRRHALHSLRVGELRTGTLPNGIVAVAMWEDGPLGAVLFRAGPGARLFSFDSFPCLHLEAGTLRPVLRRWKWSGASGFGLHDDVEAVPPADAVRVVGQSHGRDMTLRCGQAGADVVAFRVTFGARRSLVRVGTDGFFVLGRSAGDAAGLAMGLDRAGHELPETAFSV